MKTIFLRAIEAEDKSATLLMAIHDPESARGKHRFEVDPASFAGVPRSPFAYWISERLRRVFVEFAAFSIHHLAIRGAYTTNDFLFYLLAWEIKPERIAVARLETFVDKPFVLLAKGGYWSPYYHDVHLAIRWSDDGVQAKAYLAAYRESKGWGTDWSACLNGYGQYFRPGLTWPRRTTSRLALRVMPAGCIFADKGPAAFVPQDDDQALLSLLAIANSSAFGAVTELQLAAADAAARSYEVGVIQRTPVPQLSSDDQSTLATLSRRAWSLKRSLDTRNETSHAFAIPALLQVAGETLVGRSSAWSDYVPRIEAELTTIQAEVDARCFNLYGIDEADRRAITEGFGGSVVSDDAESDEEGDAEEAAADAASLAAELVSWSVGVAFGRFDVRLGTGTRAVPPEPEPFDPLPACSPGMLTGDDGLPLTAAPKGYPIQPPDSGIMVDDLGHALDLGAAVRSVFDPVFGDEAEARWQEAVAILDPRSQAPPPMAPESLLRAPPEALFQEPASGPDLLAALLLWRRLHDLALLPPISPRYALFGPQRLRQAQAPARAVQARPPAWRGRSSTHAEPSRSDRGPGIVRLRAGRFRRGTGEGRAALEPGPQRRRHHQLRPALADDRPYVLAQERQGLLGHALRRRLRLVAPGHAPLAGAGRAQVRRGCQSGHRPRTRRGLLGKKRPGSTGQEGPARRRLAAGDRSTGRRADQPGGKIGT